MILESSASLAPGDIVTRCRLILAEASDQSDKVRLLKNISRNMSAERIRFSDMLDLISACGELEAKIQSTEYKTKNSQVNWTTLTKGIIPGTLWCGVDDIAGDYHRLGTLWRVDKCCRAHDFCPVKVKPFKAKYKVFNFAPYTKSHCDCDEIFYNCLKRVNSSKADTFGDVFFNVLGIKCIEERLGKSCYKNTDVKTCAVLKMCLLRVQVQDSM